MFVTISTVEPKALTDINITLFDDDHVAVDLVGDTASNLLANSSARACTRETETCIARRVIYQGHHLHVESVRDHLVACDNIGVDEHFGCGKEDRLRYKV